MHISSNGIVLCISLAWRQMTQTMTGRGLQLIFIAMYSTLFGTLLITRGQGTGTCSTEEMRRTAVNEVLAQLGCAHDNYNCGM